MGAEPSCGASCFGRGASKSTGSGVLEGTSAATAVAVVVIVAVVPRVFVMGGTGGGAGRVTLPADTEVTDGVEAFGR